MAAPDSVTIRAATAGDWDAIWKILQATVARGDTFVHEPGTSREEALAYWFASGTKTFVAERDQKILGSYILRPNQPGLGAHVANAGFMVEPAARGLGVGRLLGEHCLREARGSAIARCSLILSSRPMSRPCACGSSLVSRSSGPCQARFVMRKKDSWMFTLCSVRSRTFRTAGHPPFTSSSAVSNATTNP